MTNDSFLNSTVEIHELSARYVEVIRKHFQVDLPEIILGVCLFINSVLAQELVSPLTGPQPMGEPSRLQSSQLPPNKLPDSQKSTHDSGIVYSPTPHL